MEDIYIHYGSKTFNSKLYDEIENYNFVKPIGGLWASNINAKYGWKDWCKDNNFRECIEENSFKFKLIKGSRLLKINNSKALKDLPVVYPRCNTRWINLDFEKLKKDYDAIEVLISNDSKLYWDLYGWDCDSLLVLNKDCIEIINS